MNFIQRFLAGCIGGMIGYWFCYGLRLFVERLQNPRIRQQVGCEFQSDKQNTSLDIDIDAMSKLYVKTHSKHDLKVSVTTSSTGDVMVNIRNETEEPETEEPEWL